MKDVDFYQWWLPANEMWKRRKSSWKMSEEDAHRMYPGAEKIESTKEVRFIATTDEERASFATSLHSMIKGAGGPKF